MSKVSLSQQRRAKACLEPARLDHSVCIGSGSAGRVYRSGGFAIKVAHGTPAAQHRVAEEIALLQSQALVEAGVPVPVFYTSNSTKTAFVRQFLAGPSLYETLCDADLPVPVLSPAHLDALFALYLATERFREATGQTLDFAPAHLFYDAAQHQYILGDVGLRLDPSPFLGTTRNNLTEKLRAYMTWREQLERAQLQPMDFPPSGRFHIEVPVGPIKKGRVLWHNTWLQTRLGLPWTRQYIRRIAGVATHARKLTTALPASRYQDAAGKGDGYAKGDGRALYLGELPATDLGPKELMLKGCGPTPLAWHGNEFHEDGFVSFQRTLWETSVAQELARLGFASPEMLAVLGTGQSTIDNTLIEWPAAAAVRVASTHFRVGHLVHAADDPEELAALCRHVGQRLVRPDFSPTKVTHIKELMHQFSQRLGWYVGRTDALNIHGFNPTMGNVRLDGHLLDFSTIRFFRHYVPHFRYMNNSRQVREHKAAMRQHPGYLVMQLQRGGLLTKAQALRLKSKCSKAFSSGYTEGYIDGFSCFLGLPASTWRHHSPHRLHLFVQETIQLRKLRASETLDFAFWQQSCPAPLFDLEGQMPAFLRAWRRGQPTPWKTLRSSFAGELKAFGACIARTWFDQLQALLPPALLRTAAPRRWEEIISPFMELEALAKLCYQHSTPAQFDEWRCHMSMVQQLPQGTYQHHDAQRLAAARGHLSFPTLEPGSSTYLVGMTAPLYHAICNTIEDTLEAHGAALIGVVAYGARVCTLAASMRHEQIQVDTRRWHLVEAGPTAPQTSRLHLMIFVEPGPTRQTLKSVSEAIFQRLQNTGAPFVIGMHPKYPLLQASEATNLTSAIASAPFAKYPQRVALLYDPAKGCDPAHASWK